MLENYREKNLEKRSETFAETLNSMFSVKGSSKVAIVKFIITLALFGWTIDSILPILHDVSLYSVSLFPKDKVFTDSLKESLVKAFLPFLFFCSFLIFLYKKRRNNLVSVTYQVKPSTPCKCLIFMLSIYNPRQSNLSFEDVNNKLDSGTLTLNEIFSTNWGNLAYTVYFHSQILEKVYLVTSKEAYEYYSEAEKLIKHVARMQGNENVKCDNVKIGEKSSDSNDIATVANKINEIYRDLIPGNFNLAEVKANLTGATSAMTGGMTLATLDDERRVEYINQNIGLTEESVKNPNIMLEPITNYKIAK